MYLQILKNIMVSKKLNRSDVANLARVSRACVSKWFRTKQGWVNVESDTLRKLATGLNISPDLFLKERADLSVMETRFLWDRLYPDMEN
ncbi:MAG: helix-turn-helix transcriptional regulator, partial [Deltaproteobacteria bacterium]|nr:helix-turn-helix transcriptional regulator [Deltaproteobacteria bacterium]